LAADVLATLEAFDEEALDEEALDEVELDVGGVLLLDGGGTKAGVVDLVVGAGVHTGVVVVGAGGGGVGVGVGVGEGAASPPMFHVP
jgi:class 3 adenylate cyclase